MRPVSEADGHDAPRLLDKLVPGEAAVIENVFIGLEYPVRQLVVAHELPYSLSWIEFGTFGRQRHQGDVGGDLETCRHVPASLVDEQHGVAGVRHSRGDFREVQVHRLDVAGRQDESGTLAFRRTDGAEDTYGVSR